MGHEVFPIIGGLSLGFFLALVRPALRLPVGTIVALVLGTLATIASGEFRVSWDFLAIDIPGVALSAACSCFLATKIEVWKARPGRRQTF
jgi:hypothetical protein